MNFGCKNVLRKTEWLESMTESVMSRNSAAVPELHIIAAWPKGNCFQIWSFPVYMSDFWITCNHSFLFQKKSFKTGSPPQTCVSNKLISFLSSVPSRNRQERNTKAIASTASPRMTASGAQVARRMKCCTMLPYKRHKKQVIWDPYGCFRK